MLIDVIPLKHTLSTDPFLYSISETWKDDIQIGSLVEIPVGKNIDLGVVSKIYMDTPDWADTNRSDTFELKPIIAVIASTPLLTMWMIESILQISKKYFIPIHKIISLFIPAPLLSRLDKKNYILEKTSLPEKRNPPMRTIHHFLSRIFSPKDLVAYSQKWDIFCFPDDLFALSFFPKDMEKSELILNESTSTKKSQVWMDMYHAKEDIIIWTRRILYYNLQAYKRILYIEDSFWKEQFQYPTRIRTLDILRALADHTNIDIVIVSSSASLDLFADFRDFSIENKK